MNFLATPPSRDPDRDPGKRAEKTLLWGKIKWLLGLLVTIYFTTDRKQHLFSTNYSGRNNR